MVRQKQFFFLYRQRNRYVQKFWIKKVLHNYQLNWWETNSFLLPIIADWLLYNIWKVRYNQKNPKKWSKSQSNLVLARNETAKFRIYCTKSWFTLDRCFETIFWSWYQNMKKNQRMAPFFMWKFNICV